MMSKFDKIRKLVLGTRLWILLVIINLLGTAYGFYFYGDQLRETSMLLWLFVADSPLSTLGVAAAVAWRKLGTGNKYLDAYAFLANLKYGLWTVTVLLIYFNGYTSINSTSLYLFLLFSHLGMAVQAFLLTDLELRPVALFGVFFLLNDLIDYSIEIHPFVPSESVLMAATAAFSLTVLSVVVAVYRERRKRIG